MMQQQPAGVSLLEIIIVIAILGMLLALFVVWPRPTGLRQTTQNLKALIQQARFEAIDQGRPVALTWDDSRKAFSTRSGNTFGSANICTSGNILQTQLLSEYGNLSLSRNGLASLGNGLIWLPSGLARGCNNNPLANRTITLRDRFGRESSVIISRAGRVRVD